MKILSIESYARLFMGVLLTTQGKILIFAIIAGLIYLPTWLSVVFRTTFVYGQSTLILNLGFLYFGLKIFWQKRECLANMNAFWEDRLVGYFLMSGGFVALISQFESASIQAFSAMLVLSGSLVSVFGLKILQRYPLACFILLLSLYPDWVFLSNLIFRFLTGPTFLEDVMAQWGSFALNQIGQSAAASGQYITLPAGSVLVLPGCSGFDMAFSVAVCGLLVGLFMNQSLKRIGVAVFMGIALALVLNIPRIVLLSLAAVYWGQESFDFWHGVWGGQIFSGIMFTIYYYVVMALYRGAHRFTP